MVELEPEAVKRLVLAKTMGLEADVLPIGNLDPYKYVFLFKINVGSLPQEDVSEYMSRVSKILGDGDLPARGIITYFVPVRDIPTSLSIVNLATMVVGKL